MHSNRQWVIATTAQKRTQDMDAAVADTKSGNSQDVDPTANSLANNKIASVFHSMCKHANYNK